MSNAHTICCSVRVKGTDDVAEHVASTIGSALYHAGFVFEILDYAVVDDQYILLDLVVPIDIEDHEDVSDVCYSLVDDIRNETGISLDVNEIFEGEPFEN